MGASSWHQEQSNQDKLSSTAPSMPCTTPSSLRPPLSSYTGPMEAPLLVQTSASQRPRVAPTLTPSMGPSSAPPQPLTPVNRRRARRVAGETPNIFIILRLTSQSRRRSCKQTSHRKEWNGDRCHSVALTCYCDMFQWICVTITFKQYIVL